MLNSIRAKLVAWLTGDKGLIQTKLGNVPLDILEYRTGWHISQEQVVFCEEYYYKDELVRNNVHVFKPQGMVSTAKEGNLNG